LEEEALVAVAVAGLEVLVEVVEEVEELVADGN
jgi:hypothetical protein